MYIVGSPGEWTWIGQYLTESMNGIHKCLAAES